MYQFKEQQQIWQNHYIATMAKKIAITSSKRNAGKGSTNPTQEKRPSRKLSELNPQDPFQIVCVKQIQTG